MNANRQNKEAIVKEISQKLKDSQALVVATYAGLSVKEISQLRFELAEKGVEFKVYKNRLFKIAAKEAGLDILESLTGPNAFAFGMEDDISPAKVIASFAKKHKVVKFVAGTYEGKVVGVEELNEIATLPTMEEALTKLALALMTPLKDTAIGLNMLVEEGHLKKEGAPTKEVKETKDASKDEVKKEEKAKEDTKDSSKDEVKKEEKAKEDTKDSSKDEVKKEETKEGK